eukprot:950566-Pyramimonas_sp.AAC.1
MSLAGAAGAARSGVSPSRPGGAGISSSFTRRSATVPTILALSTVTQRRSPTRAIDRSSKNRH